MRRVWANLRNNGRLSVLQIEPLLQYHDELVFQGPEGCFEEAKGIITEAMCADSEGFRIPIESKMVVGKDWGSLK
jgi:DNA polymerase I-like protein with 3'-5' exonuclease and polymerase domains